MGILVVRFIVSLVLLALALLAKARSFWLHWLRLLL
jgi:hypothetical protein